MGIQARAGGNELDLASQHWRKGNVTAFQKMTPEEIVKIQVLRIDPLGKRHHLERPITVERNKREIEALLVLLGRATAFTLRR